jgi:uncharacterized protein
MRCPRCESVVLEELDRNGITVDRCASCRGIWLDRGELEKLMARAAAEDDARAPAAPRAHARSAEPYSTSARQHARDGYDDSEPPSSSRRGHYGRKPHRSFWHDLFD